MIGAYEVRDALDRAWNVTLSWVIPATFVGALVACVAGAVGAFSGSTLAAALWSAGNLVALGAVGLALVFALVRLVVRRVVYAGAWGGLRSARGQA